MVTRTWGRLVRDRTKWEGMIGLLLNDEADIAISSTALQTYREKVISFNIPSNEIRFSAFFRIPQNSVLGNGLTRPFRFGIWLSIGLWTLAMGFSLVIMLFMIERNIIIDHVTWNLWDCLLWPVSTLCLKSYKKIPTNSSIRIVVITGLISSVIIFGAYSGTLRSFLFVHADQLTSVSNLLKTNFKFSVIGETAIHGIIAVTFYNFTTIMPALFFFKFKF